MLNINGNKILKTMWTIFAISIIVLTLWTTYIILPKLFKGKKISFNDFDFNIRETNVIRTYVISTHVWFLLNIFLQIRFEN